MKQLWRNSSSWHAGPPAWGPAMVAGLGCALPLLLGLFSGHTGFLWASVGAFQAAQASPLHRFGMLRMLLLTGLGACSAALGFWSAVDPLVSLGLFGGFGLLLAWLQRFGSEAGKMGLGLVVCLCLGQGQHGIGNLNNPHAIATLFILGGLWVMLLAFGLRGLHGMRMWPYMPRFIGILKVLRRHARRLPRRQWRLHALGCTLAMALAGTLVSLAGLHHGYWLTLTVLTTLQLEFQGSLVRALQSSLTSMAAAGLLILLGHSLQDPTLMVLSLIPLIFLSRALQASHYALFVMQSAIGFVLLAESLSRDWQLAQLRLLNVLFGVVLALFVALLMYGLRQLLEKRAQRSAAAHRTP
ncbi:FUSC family protein [Pseudomonas lalucatii]|uniref:FUSC family protein n=1 Tax=Pseudomonas lalucatii TaxID=1424203 RepID=A0ABS5PWY6_9PSED|nr:FUSC family protein [Pseudomonas lalucatii]MBS7661000.1 FUSC family protein [Pseudomonas lalucatii]MBS7691550.1 FUSC family protein [Pseudomonas lalucatii]MBS7724333.1 FUSC family protein [Pseudomonas lalucatii]QVM87676.1 FUSC family protein [Pseudomonas lalucatii]